MKTKKSDYITKISAIFSTMFFVLCGFSIYESINSIKVSELGIESIAPENLITAPEMFQLKLKVESEGFPVDEMIKTKAWKDLERKTGAYSERLELLEAQNRQRSYIVCFMYLLSAIGMAIFAKKSANTKKMG